MVFHKYDSHLISISNFIKIACCKLFTLGWSEILSECVGVARGMKNESLVEFLKRWDVESKTGPDPFPLHLAVQNADLTEVKDRLFIFSVLEHALEARTSHEW